MRLFFQALIIATLAMSVVACGLKGSLKSPSQIHADEQKKAQKAARAAKRNGTSDDDAAAAPETTPAATPEPAASGQVTKSSVIPLLPMPAEQK